MALCSLLCFAVRTHQLRARLGGGSAAAVLRGASGPAMGGRPGAVCRCQVRNQCERVDPVSEWLVVSAGDAVEDAVTALMCRGFGAQALGVVSRCWRCPARQRGQGLEALLQHGPAQATAAEYREVDVLGGGKQAATVNEDMLIVAKFKSEQEFVLQLIS